MNDFGIKTLSINEPLIFEQGSEGRTAFSLPEENIDLDKIDGSLPDELIRDTISCFPEISEVEWFEKNINIVLSSQNIRMDRS